MPILEPQTRLVGHAHRIEQFRRIIASGMRHRNQDGHGRMIAMRERERGRTIKPRNRAEIFGRRHGLGWDAVVHNVDEDYL